MKTDTAAWKPEKPVLMLRTCDHNMQGYEGFQWPGVGDYVEAPDWNPEPVCGGGLHGLAWGKGSASYLSSDEDAKWIVWCAEEAETVLVIQGGADKHKARRGIVLCVGSREEATICLYGHDLYQSRDSQGCYSTLTGGDGSTLTGGDGSTLTGGDRSTLTGGDRSTLTGGDGSTLTGGDGSTLTGGDRSTLTGGDRSTLTGGDGSTLTGGDGSTLIIKRWNGKRYKVTMAEVKDATGDGQLKPNCAYRLNERFEFEEVPA